MSPAFILGGCLVWLATIAGSYVYGVGVGQDIEIATQAREDKIVHAVSVAMSERAASAISNIEVKHVTIRQRAETVMRDVPVYRECRHDRRVLDDINAARGFEPTGGGVVPAASATTR